jgi:hypothetical protein
LEIENFAEYRQIDHAFEKFYGLKTLPDKSSPSNWIEWVIVV